MGVLLISAVLNLTRLSSVGSNGVGNYYYAAAVRSMLTSWHNWFYLSVDPSGFVAVDKPPLALWIQSASAVLFGFDGAHAGWSLLLPQALAGVASVAVMYRLVARAYGPWPGVLAALVLAVSPVNVVANRSNHADALLLLTMLLAAWAMWRSVETSSRRWLLLCAALLAVGFNLKMLAIGLVVPALGALYLLGGSLPWRRRLADMGWAALLFLAIALPWMLAVQLTPAALRPWVGGTQHNSPFELMVGYNGLARLWGEDWRSLLGAAGPQRLWNRHLGGEIGWLLALALAGGVLGNRRLRLDAHSPAQETLRRQALILWCTWLAWQMLYFSISSYYHSYYLALMAPAVAALVGVAGATLWRYRRQLGFLLLVLASVVLQIVILQPHGRDYLWLALVPPNLAWVAFMGLKSRALGRLGERLAYSCVFAALLVAPTVWATLPVLTCTSPTLPTAGPPMQACRPNQHPFLDPELVAFLQRDRQGARYLAATYDMGISTLGILQSGDPWMTVGGYRGTDPILTPVQFQAMTCAGEVRYWVALNDEPEFPAQREVVEWVQAHCPIAPIKSEGVIVRGPCDCR